MSQAASFQIAVVCEGPADVRLATELADRLLCQDIDWIEREILDRIRQWRGVADGDLFLSWSKAVATAKEHGFRVNGKFKDRSDYRAARCALLVLNLTRPDAVILMRDTDGDLTRQSSLEWARREAEREENFPPVLLALPHTKRECWVLAGFEPQTESERRILEDLRQELGSDPRFNAETLSAAEPGARRNAKRVLEALTGGDQDRESACWAEGDLQTLRERGFATGLADYLDEIRNRLVPVFSGGRPPRS